MSIAADVIFVGGKVMTMTGRREEVEAVAVLNGRIVAVGRRSEVEETRGPKTRFIDLKGKTLMPGLADIHVHLATGARDDSFAECRDFYDPAVSSVQVILSRLAERARESAPGDWVVGTGSPMQAFRLSERRLPTKRELDAAVPENPAYVTFGAHILVANSQALREKGITAATPDPPGGMIERDPGTSEPTGVLRERAQYLVKPRGALPGPTPLSDLIKRHLDVAARRGVTTIHDIVVSSAEMAAYQDLADKDLLPVRIRLLVRVVEAGFSRDSLLDLGLRHRFGSDMLKIGGIKLSIDGGFTARQGAFYGLDSETDNHALVRIDQPELDDVVMRYHEAGMRICVHVVGDMAMDMALDAFQKALARYPRVDHRHRVEHMGNWLFTEERRNRTVQLGLLPVPNPAVMYFLGDMAYEAIGSSRMKGAFALRTMLASGIPVSFGSDAPGYWPVDVLRDIAACVGRKTFLGTAVAPEEAMTVAQALLAQTVTAAWVGFDERSLGTVEPGKLADLIVLEEDPLRVPWTVLKDIPVNLTMVGGKIVHETPGALD
ncbi:MAG: amidohydrolase [Bacillota bacterium]